MYTKHNFNAIDVILGSFDRALLFKLISMNLKNIYTMYLLSFVETPRKFIIAELSIRKLGSSSVLIILMKIRAYGSKALQ